MIDNKLTQQIKENLYANLSKKRFTHSINVAQEAYKLAKKYGADCDKAYFCGLVHDICKETSPDIQQKLILDSDLDVSAVELKSKPLWHAISGAQYLKEQYNITDYEILRSVRYHTVARKDMSLMEKIIYLSDLVSEERKYKGVEEMRKLCYKDIDTAMLEALRFCLTDSISKGSTIPASSLEAYNQYALVKDNE